MVHRIFVVSAIAEGQSPVRVYTIEKRFSVRELRTIGRLLANPVSERFYINAFPRPASCTRAFETGFLPGVTDNVGHTVREMIEDELGVRFVQGEGVYTSQITYVELPINPLIQRVAINENLPVPRVRLTNRIKADKVSLDVSDEELVTIGKLGIKNADGSRRGPLALDLPSMRAIQTHFRNLGRDPTDVELESLAQTWSEHCKHTIFNSPIDNIAEGLFRRYIKRATEEIRKKKGRKDFCVSVFSDNSGAIAFDRRWVVTHKVETHNSPSALDPFGGAITGIVGVNRDCIGFGLGAKPVANTYGFCVGDLSDKTDLYRDKKCTQPRLTPRRILDGVVAGVNSGGNCSGIPTPQGFVLTHPRYGGKPLVFVGTVGILPRSRMRKGARSGDLVVMIGGRVGLDGIHGATFSSEALTSGSPATAVQIGDPITQKKLSDMLIREACDRGLYHSITDNGAGGLSCSVAEMARDSGGCLVDLDRVPLKYPGLTPWQIWISESQERMTLAVPKKEWRKLKALCSRRGVEASVIGTFTKSGRCIVRYRRKKVMDLSMDFLHNGFPRIPLHTKPQPRRAPPNEASPFRPETLSHPSIAGFSWISQQFDHEVQGTSVTKPLQGKGRVNGDATVIRPILSSNRGIVLTHALHPEFGEHNPYQMARVTISQAVLRAVAAGADPEKIALLDNFCWSSAKDPTRLWQLKEAARGCYDGAMAYGTPFISGKDSMFNDFSGFDEHGNPVSISILPTLLISAIGIIRDVRKSVTIDFKFPGDLVYVLSGAKSMYDALALAIRRELVASAMVVSRGGMAAAVAKSAMAGMLGVDVSLKMGKVIVSVNPKKKPTFERMMEGSGCKPIGVVTKTPEIVIGGQRTALETCIKAYRTYET